MSCFDGTLPKKCRQLVREWAELHQNELLGCGTRNNSALLHHWRNTMKLIAFKPISAYHFLLTFEDGETLEADLQALIGHHVALDALHTARLDAEWGCLEFNGGTVDIEPNTLFRFAGGHSETRVAA